VFDRIWKDGLVSSYGPVEGHRERPSRAAGVSEQGRSGGSNGAGRGDGALPTFLIIGAQKCGTSALHSYLDRHPEISMSRPKDLDFFLAVRNWSRGEAWYRSRFDPRSPARGEASPNYTAHPVWQDVAERMVRTVPDARLVYLVRDPLARIASHWAHNWALRREVAPLDVVLRREPIYVARSRYMAQLDEYLRVFPVKQLLVLEQQDLLARRTQTLERVFAFLGVDPSYRHSGFDVDVNRSGDKRRVTRTGAFLDRAIRRTAPGRLLAPGAIPRLEGLFMRGSIPRPDVRAALPDGALQQLTEDAARLRAFTGQPLDHWTV